MTPHFPSNTYLPIACVLMLLLAPSLILAQPPFETSTSTSGCEIVYPKIDIIQKSTGFFFHFHVINSTGAIRTNETTTCIFNLYDHTGEHIYINENVSYSADSIADFVVNVSGSNFTKKGFYAYTFQCYDSESGCFVSAPLTVTGNGMEPATDFFQVFIYALFILVGLAMIFSLFYIIAKFATVNMTLYDLLFSYGAYFTFIISYYLGSSYLVSTFTENMVESFIMPFGVTHIIVATLAFIVTFIYKGTTKKRPPKIGEI